MPSVISATTTNGVAISPDNSGSLQLQTNNGTTAVTIDTSQNVGIGTSSPSSYGKLAVYAASGSTFASVISGSNQAYIGYDGIYGASAIESNGALAFGTGASFAERMRIDSSGRVGIGTSSPSSPLHIVGNSSGNFLLGGIRINDTNNSSDYFIGGVGSGGFQIATAGGATRMVITSGGDALIGATSSVFSRERLHLYKNGGEGLSIVNDNNNYGSIFVRGLNSGTCAVLLIRNSADSTVGSITHNGTNTTYGTSSDYRLKENVAPMTGALDKVSLLKPVTYTWKSDGSEGQGFIAHELQEVIPDAVVGEKDAVEEDGSIKSQQIDTSFLVATLTAAIQELKGIVDIQAAKIAELEAKLPTQEQ